MISKEQSTVRVVETIEEWIPTGLSFWNNTQLRLSIKSNPDDGIDVSFSPFFCITSNV